MDPINIPTCALHRQSTTVIVRIKMEVSRFCGHTKGCPTVDYPKIVHRPSGCELCSRTRSNSKYSDCDSGIVENCRPYKSSAARSRYVNVCAAVCLLLLIGGLSPKSCAAPYRSHNMDGKEQASEEENQLWRDPCGYNNSNSGSQYSSDTALKVARAAEHAYGQAAEYKDSFAKWQSFDTFKLLLEQPQSQWLKANKWVTEEVLPEEMKIIILNAVDNKAVDEEVKQAVDKKIKDVLESDSTINTHLPSMYKGLKLIMANLHKLGETLKRNGLQPDHDMAEHIKDIENKIRQALCYFYDLMKSRGLEILPVYDKDLPEINKDNSLEIGLNIYPDTLYYLKYLQMVFKKMSEKKSEQ